jgi:hypothetical protein
VPGSEFTVLHAFSASDTGGTQPRNNQLLEGSDGNLYGTTEATIYMLTSGGQFRLLHNVTSVVESDRWGWGYSKLLEWFDGNFYAAGRFGGPGGNGVVFRLNSERSPCTNELKLAYFGDEVFSRFQMDQLFKTEKPALTGALLVSQFGVTPLWLELIAPVTPARAFQFIDDAFPRIGLVGVFSFIVTNELEVCADWETVDTGGSGPTDAELKRRVAEAIGGYFAIPR